MAGLAVDWPDEIDEILGGDLAVGVAYLTPAKGVVIAPMTTLGMRDREAGTITLTTSLGLWRKLDRIRRNPGVAIAYHTREHGFTDRPGFVLAQGRGSFSTEPDRAWLEAITPQWERFLGPRTGGPLGRLLDTYHWQRIAITIAVERIVAWPRSDASGESQTFGSARPAPPAPQAEPRKGTGPRLSTSKVAADVERLPHALLGWCGTDLLPEVVPVTGASADERGVRLNVPDALLPPGARRAGLTVHSFRPRMVGQEQRMHTGWLERDGDAVTYAPHTRTGYGLPRSKLAYDLACASLVFRMRGARAARLA